MATERDKLFGKEPLEKVADVMAAAGAGSHNDQTAKAEFMFRQTKAQIDAARATEDTAHATQETALATARAAEATERGAGNTKKSVRWLAASALALAISDQRQLRFRYYRTHVKNNYSNQKK